MNERSIFMEALEKDTEQRASFLEKACGGDAALRQRVEALLKSHEEARSFLGKPIPERLADYFANPRGSGETQGEPASGRAGGAPLGFLTPSSNPASLGRLGHYDVLEVI